MLIHSLDENTPTILFSKPEMLAIRQQFGAEAAIIALHNSLQEGHAFSVRFLRAKKRGQKWKARSDALSIECEHIDAEGKSGWYSSAALTAAGWTKQEATARFFQQLFVPELYFLNQERDPLTRFTQRRGAVPVSTIVLCNAGWQRPESVLKGAHL